jgi:hypothetical protein
MWTFSEEKIRERDDAHDDYKDEQQRRNGGHGWHRFSHGNHHARVCIQNPNWKYINK